jgi:hypothetical protein
MPALSPAVGGAPIPTSTAGVRSTGGGSANGANASTGRTAIGSLTWKQQVSIEGEVRVVRAGTAAGRSLEVQVFDETGGIQLLFFGRTAIAGIIPGARIHARGRVGEYKGHLALANPRYDLLER